MLSSSIKLRKLKLKLFSESSDKINGEISDKLSTSRMAILIKKNIIEIISFFLKEVTKIVFFNKFTLF